MRLKYFAAFILLVSVPALAQEERYTLEEMANQPNLPAFLQMAKVPMYCGNAFASWKMVGSDVVAYGEKLVSPKVDITKQQILLVTGPYSTSARPTDLGRIRFALEAVIESKGSDDRVHVSFICEAEFLYRQ